MLLRLPRTVSTAEVCVDPRSLFAMHVYSPLLACIQLLIVRVARPSVEQLIVTAILAVNTCQTQNNTILTLNCFNSWQHLLQTNTISCKYIAFLKHKYTASSYFVGVNSQKCYQTVNLQTAKLILYGYYWVRFQTPQLQVIHIKGNKLGQYTIVWTQYKACTHNFFILIIPIGY